MTAAVVRKASPEACEQFKKDMMNPAIGRDRAKINFFVSEAICALRDAAAEAGASMGQWEKCGLRMSSTALGALSGCATYYDAATGKLATQSLDRKRIADIIREMNDTCFAAPEQGVPYNVFHQRLYDFVGQALRTENGFRFRGSS